MRKNTARNLSVLLVALVAALTMALAGCSAPAASDSGSSSATADSSAAVSASTSASDSASADASSTAPASPAATTISDRNWLGDWTSSSEIVPPETPTQQYSLTTNEDGTFTILDEGKELYAGTFTDVNAEKGAGWGQATINGTTINLQLVNAQGAYKLIFNAGDDWDKSLKKIVFI